MNRYLDVPTHADLDAEIIAALRVLLPDWEPDMGDPVVYWSDDTSGRLIELINKFNTSADANSILTAKGAALRELLSQFGILSQDLTGNETDAELLDLFISQWNRITQGTPAWDIARAKDADSKVADVGRGLLDWAANTISLYVLDSQARNLTAAERTAIQNELNREDKPTFWLDYRVPEATIDHYLVSGRLVYDARLSDPIAAVRENLDAALLSLRRLDTGIDDSTLINMAWDPAVRRMELDIIQARLVGGKLVPGVFAPMPADPSVVRYGYRNVEVELPAGTSMSMGWGADNTAEPTLNISGTAGTTRLSTSANNFLWVRVNAVGEFSAATLQTSAGVQIPLIQKENDLWVSESLASDTNNIKGGRPNVVFNATRHWPDISSTTQWT